MFAGQVIVGSSVSLTVTVNVQVAVLVAASVVEQVTVVVPLAKVDPLAGVQVTLTAPSQASKAVGALKLTTALQWPASVPWLRLAGQAVKAGAWLSTTVTVKVQALVSPLASVAVQVTVVVPLLKG